MNKTSPIVLVTTTALLAFSGLVFAEETTQVPPGTPLPTRARGQVMQEKRVDFEATIKNVRDNLKANAVDLRTNTKEQMPTRDGSASGGRMATTSIERREIERSAVEQRKGLMETRKASSTEIRDQRKELARQHVGAIEKRYGIALRQFENLIARIQSRIEKMKGNGYDTGQAESALRLAISAVTQAKIDAQALVTVGEQVQSGEDAKRLRPQIGDAVKKLHASVKLAHQELVKTGKALIEVYKMQRQGVPTDTQASGSTNL
jgi:hypothetical protein